MFKRFCKKCNKDTERLASSEGRCKLCRDIYQKRYVGLVRSCATPLCNALAFRKGTYCQRCGYESNLRNRYSISLENYGWLAYSQNFNCALCLKPLEFSTRRGAVVDHCHKTRQIRGLLHGACNTAIGLFEEDPVKIEQAALYIRNFLNRSEV